MTAAPKISVLMAVHNGADTLVAAIGSILTQGFTDFEFIIVDDGSGDSTPDILADYARRDPRVRIITQANTGLTRALNNGAAQARGLYIARQDADDISYPERFARQAALLDARPEIVAAGTAAHDVYPDGRTRLWRAHDEKTLQNIVFFKTPFPHSTAMIRTAAFRACGGYDETFRTAQDMELWMRLAKIGRLAMLSEPLIRRAVGGNTISRRRRFLQFRDALRARWRHNPGLRKIPALYHSLRSLIIGSLPPAALNALKPADGMPHDPEYQR